MDRMDRRVRMDRMDGMDRMDRMDRKVRMEYRFVAFLCLGVVEVKQSAGVGEEEGGI